MSSRAFAEAHDHIDTADVLLSLAVRFVTFRFMCVPFHSSLFESLLHVCATFATFLPFVASRVLLARFALVRVFISPRSFSLIFSF